MKRALRGDERAAATVVGAIVVLAILGTALLYVNTFHVPRQGGALEVAARERVAEDLSRLAADLTGEPAAFATHVALRPERPSPPLLSGIVLSPVLREGSLALEPDGTRITLSHLVERPEGGVPAGDPMRQDLGDGTVRVYDLGNATGGFPLGALRARVGGAYLEEAHTILEGGMLLDERRGATGMLAPAALRVERWGSSAEPATRLAWRIPLLAGDGEQATGAGAARVSLSPGPVASVGGGARVLGVTIHLETAHVTAWETALQDAFGSHGVVAAARTGGDEGTVTATILPSPGEGLEMDLHLVRYAVEIGT